MNIINAQIKALLEEPDQIACFANLSACLKSNYEDCNWAGFYFVKKKELVLGPFQGNVACSHIPFDKGVCGKCYTTKEPQLIDDVCQFKGHIACDSASRSELCVPIIVNNVCVAEIDLDSPSVSRWTNKECEEMVQAAEDIANAYIEYGW